MDLQAEKLNLIQKLMGISQASLLDKVNQLIDNEMIVGYTTDGEPLTKNAYNERLANAERQIENGESDPF